MLVPTPSISPKAPVTNVCTQTTLPDLSFDPHPNLLNPQIHISLNLNSIALPIAVIPPFLFLATLYLIQLNLTSSFTNTLDVNHVSVFIHPMKAVASCCVAGDAGGDPREGIG